MTERGAMTPARKRRIWEARGKVCGGCHEPVPCTGGGVVYDHDIQLWMDGPEDDANVWPLCARCNKLKTAGDAKARAKVRRLWKKALGQPRAASRLRGPGWRKDLRKRMNGRVEKR